MGRAKKPKKPKPKTPKKKLLGDEPRGVCMDCAKEILWREEYIVRPEVWTEATGKGYHDSGLLHRACLERRLGRNLTDADLLVTFTRHNKDGSMRFNAHPDAVAFLKDK
jgi:hypothetical protein